MKKMMTAEELSSRRKRNLIIGLVLFLFFSMSWDLFTSYRMQLQTSKAENFLTFNFDNKDLQKMKAKNRQVTYVDKNGIKVMVPKTLNVVIDIKEGEILISETCGLSLNKDYKFIPMNKDEKDIETGKGVIFMVPKESKLSMSRFNSCNAIFVKSA